ncbi:hypothetical protein M513_12616 [Trichuris suis]|uniref:Uncharacterized protein n=1 Tax=Trichuris suis TaxID=68888 RepID=A0A085LNF6_9BILA|nr:hypothetical protein M513_12616 [Trichuris suis]
MTKYGLPAEEKPGVVYEVTCSCSASCIGETGNRLSQRSSDQHLSCPKHYKNALSDLQGKTRRRGRPRKTKPHIAMNEAVKTSAIVEHASCCDGQLLSRVICREKDFKLRKIKEARDQPRQRKGSQRYVDQPYRTKPAIHKSGLSPLLAYTSDPILPRL